MKLKKIWTRKFQLAANHEIKLNTCFVASKREKNARRYRVGVGDS